MTSKKKLNRNNRKNELVVCGLERKLSIFENFFCKIQQHYDDMYENGSNSLNSSISIQETTNKTHLAIKFN